jgi:6-phosphofructokinase 1
MAVPEDTRIESLGERRFDSPLKLALSRGTGQSVFVSDDVRVRYEVEWDNSAGANDRVCFEKAGPRAKLFFDPRKTTAAIVTCGGLCPGLNNVIRSATFELLHNYGVRRVLGLRYGYAGLNPAAGLPPLDLTAELVAEIHEDGGTVLGTSRGPQETAVMVDFLAKQQIDILLCVGGDGTLHGARCIAEEILKRRLPIAVVGIPKTIDNDVMYVTRTFGLISATEKAREAIDCAHNEASSAFNGVGLVKVMGRNAGFIAAAATLASQDVNFCLIPEVPFKLDGKGGFLEALQRRLAVRRHAVIIVAEGAGQDLLKSNAAQHDASGNLLLADIGGYLKQQVVSYLKGVGMPADVKYIDPSYIIRSVPANCEDSMLCDQLARHAVHAGMAGKTNLLIGYWHDTFTHLPVSLAVSASKHIDPEGPLWRSVLATTGQQARFG